MFALTDTQFISRQQLERALSNSDVLIAERAREIAAGLRKSVLTDDQDAHDIGVDTSSLIFGDVAVQVTRLTAAGDAAGLLALMQELRERATVNLADNRAEREFQALTPNDFLPG